MIRKALLPILILAFFSAVAVGMYWSRPEPEKIAPEPPSFFVEVAKAKKTIVNFEVKSQGSVSPRTETTLIAEASGQIIEVSEAFVGGGFFAKGQVLIRIDPPLSYQYHFRTDSSNPTTRSNTACFIMFRAYPPPPLSYPAQYHLFYSGSYTAGRWG